MAFEFVGTVLTNSVFLALILLLIILFAMLFVKNKRTKAKLGLVAGLFLTALAFVMGYFYIKSGRSLLEFLSVGEYYGGSGILLFLCAVVGILGWSIITLLEKK